MPKQQLSPWGMIIESMFSIPNKQGEKVDFILKPAQRELDSAATGRDLVPKARQLGVTMYLIGRFVAQCMTKNNWRAVIISHEEEATKRLLARARFIIENLRTPDPNIEMILDTERLSQAEIRFKDTGSWFYIGTAGAKAFGRGDTINALHCSELAHWPNAEIILTGILGSIPEDAEVFIESTGNGIADPFAKRVKASIDGRSHWKTHFFPWTLDPDYKIAMLPEEAKELMANLDEEYEEPKLVKEFNLTAEQLLWRRHKIADIATQEGGYVDLSKVKQEFPITIDECFQGTGETLFSRIHYEPTKSWQREMSVLGNKRWLTGHPRPGYNYIMGVDVAGGVGRDNAVIQIGCIETNEQVLTWSSNRIAPDVLIERVIKIGTQYNNSYLVVENNNHGLTVLYGLRVRDGTGAFVYPQHLIHKYKSPDSNKKESGLMDMGFQTMARTKALAVGKCRTQLANGFVIHDENTYMELQSFGETETGRLEGLDGAHDDHVMALVMMSAGWVKGTVLMQDAPQAPQNHNPAPFSLEGILQRTRQGMATNHGRGPKSFLSDDNNPGGQNENFSSNQLR